MNFLILLRQKNLFVISIFFLLVQIATGAFASTTTGPLEGFGPFKLYPRFMGVPEKTARLTIIPGLRQRAFYGLKLEQIFYDSKKRAAFFDKHPKWEKPIMYHPGYFVEMVDRSPENLGLRFYGPDTWITEDGDVRVGEENGNNAGGADFLNTVSQKFLQEPDFGDVPIDLNSYPRWIQELRQKADQFFGNNRPKVIVFADEASVTSESFDIGNGEMVSPPFAAGKEHVDGMRKLMKSIGVEFVSLIDDRGQLRVEGDHVILNRDGIERKVDVLIWLADLESSDPTYAPQVQRNIAARKQKYNDNARIVGLPGLMNAYLSGSFLMVGGPASLLSRNKIWPVLVDEFILSETGKPPILPYQKTLLLFDENGRLNEAVLSELKANPENYVFKDAIGGSGKEVTIGRNLGSEKEAFLTQFEAWARQNPYSVLAQPFVQLKKANFPRGFEDRYMAFDTRVVSLIGAVDSVKPIFLPNLVWLIRASEGDKVNISQNGHMVPAIPYSGTEVKVLPKIPFIGAKQSPFAHYVTPEDQKLILKDAAQASVMAAEFIREIYQSPERLFKAFPAMKYAVEGSFFYRKKEVADQKQSPFPAILIMGPDYGDMGPDCATRYCKYELNPTNVGGILRMEQGGVAGMEEGLKELFGKLRDIFKSKRPDSADPFVVYLIEDSQLGRKGDQKYEAKFRHELEEYRSRFRKTYGVELVSLEQMSQFQVSDKKLFYNDAGTPRQVDILFKNFEPDFIDSTEASFQELSRTGTPAVVEEFRRYSIPHLSEVENAGNIFPVNSRGHDIVGIKTLLPYYPALVKRYLKAGEVIPTLKSESFVNERGEFSLELWGKVHEQAEKYVVKDGEVTGGGGGVHVLAKKTPAEREAILQKISTNPQSWIAQQAIKPWENELSLRTEIRAITVVSFDMHSDQKPQILVQWPALYGRGGASGQEHVNLVPSGVNQVPGAVIPIRVNAECARAIAAMTRSSN